MAWIIRVLWHKMNNLCTTKLLPCKISTYKTTKEKISSKVDIIIDKHNMGKDKVQPSQMLWLCVHKTRRPDSVKLHLKWIIPFFLFILFRKSFLSSYQLCVGHRITQKPINNYMYIACDPHLVSHEMRLHDEEKL